MHRRKPDSAPTVRKPPKSELNGKYSSSNVKAQTEPSDCSYMVYVGVICSSDKVKHMYAQSSSFQRYFSLVINPNGVYKMMIQYLCSHFRWFVERARFHQTRSK